MGQGPDDKPRRIYENHDEVTTVGKLKVAPSQSPKRDRPYFIVLAGSNLGRMFRVEKTDNILGRSNAATIRLEDDGISRKHAKVEMRGQELWIEDLKSQNGTFINGQRVTVQALHDGDKIQVGTTTILKFTYHDDLDDHFQQKMYDAALHDGLTKAYNKRYFTERLVVEIAFARRHHAALTLVMLDIDHFKIVNDCFGHVAGDSVLVRLASTIQGQLRQEDIFARYGGEEFVVLCRATSLTDASALAERLRSSVEAIRMDQGGEPMAVTISLGIAAYSEVALNGATHLIAEADAALYDAKRAGRNCAVTRT
jgi:two-component system, cell cycle response regulator